MAVTPLYATDDPYSAARTAAPVVVIAATSAATAAPTGGTDGFTTGPFGTIRTLIDYAGAVTAANVRLWTKSDGVWYRGASTADGDALAPATDESREWAPGRHQEVFFQLESLTQTGGGTVTVRALGVSQ